MDHAVVQKWLRTVLGPYTDRDRVFADVDRALIAVSSLSPKTEVFTFNDGRTQLLLTLDGTIPVDFRNTTYNIPVAYWIPRDYPREPPMAFVAPTTDMAIRKGPNVDPSGEIGGEYLRRWRSKPEACNLLDLIHDCQHMFGREPPVYAKPKSTPVYATAAPSQQQQQQQQQHSQPSTPQRQSSTSSAFAAQRHGAPPSVPASPQSPHVTGGPSFQSPGAYDQRQNPPAPAPGTSSTSQEGQGQHAPHRPPKLSSSLGPTGGYATYSPGPRTSMSHTNQYGSPAPAPVSAFWEMQSLQQTGTPRFGSEEAYRRSSGTGFVQAGFGGHPSQHAALNQAQYAQQSPVTAPQSPSQKAPWQQGAALPQRRDSRQYTQYQQQQQQQHLHPQQQQRSHTSPYPASDTHHPGQHPSYNGSPAPVQTFPFQNGHATYHQPQHATGAPQPQPPPPPVPRLHPHSQSASFPSNGTNGHRNSPQPAVAPKPKGINLLDDEEGEEVDPSSSAAAARQQPGSTLAAPPPPRPINPELLALHDRVYTKLDARLTTLATTLHASNTRLEVLSSDLDRGLPAIEDELSRLKAVRDVCKTTGDRLESSVLEITDHLRALQAKDDPDPDSMVLATSIVGNQLVDLVAEDNAIEDTLYHLGRALNAERIDLASFLKQTRLLAREQFMCRALAMKVAEGMGWGE